MTALLGGPLAQAVGWALLHLLWQGALVAAILAAVLALLEKQSANARYLASCGALAVLVALSVVTAYRDYSPVVSVVASPVEDSGPPLSLVLGQPRAAVLHWTDVVNTHLSEVVFIWLLGVVVLSARLVSGWVTAHRLASRYAHLADPAWQQAMERIADAVNVRRAIQLLESAAVEVPTVIGWMRPAILLPVATLSGLSPEQIEMILAHELAHIRRHDFIVNLMQSAVETLFFYQPAVWWISRRIRIEREHCCDDIAVAVTGDALRYARALTRFEELRLDHAQAVVAASGGSLLARVRRLVRVDGESASWPSRWTAGAGLLVIVAALLVGPTLPAFAKHEDQQPTAPPKPPHVAAPPACKDSHSEITVAANANDPDDVNVDVEVPDPPDPPDPPEVPMIDVDAIVRPIIANVPAAAVRLGAAIADVTSAQMKHRLAHKINEDHPSVGDLVTLRTAGVTPQYIDEMRNAGFGDVSLEDIVALKLQNVTTGYLREMRDAGVEIPCADSAIELRATGVTPSYVREMASIGYTGLEPDDLSALRAMKVTPDFVKSLRAAGYTDLSVHDLVNLAANGVNAEFIREFARHRPTSK